MASMLVTIRLLLACFGLELLPFGIDVVFARGSALKILKYRSAKNYMSTAAIEAEGFQRR